MNRKMTRHADFLGFPIPQSELMTKKGVLAEDPAIVMDFCHVTSVPPFIKKTEDIIKEHLWFQSLVEKPESKTKYFYGLQHPPEDIPMDHLYRLVDAGISFMGIAYELENSYGGGFATPDVPLARKGKRLMEFMARAGIVLDLSHAGHQTARDALSYIHYIRERYLFLKVVATHTACHSVYGHRRNLPDDVLKGIVDRGGIIGLATATFMLHPTNNTLYPFYDHLHHLLKVVGADHIALGTDGIYRKMDIEEGQKLFQMMKEKIDPRGNFQARYPDQPIELNRPDRLKVIEEGMLKHGISPVTTRKVMGENLIKFFSGLKYSP